MSNKTLLIVDDNADTRFVIKIILRHLGLHFIEATSNEQSIEIAKTELPDLILISLSNQYKDDYEATRLIKSEKLTSHIPIMVLSEYFFCDDGLFKSGAYEAGANWCVSKPINPKELGTAIIESIRFLEEKTTPTEQRFCHTSKS